MHDVMRISYPIGNYWVGKKEFMFCRLSIEQWKKTFPVTRKQPKTCFERWLSTKHAFSDTSQAIVAFVGFTVGFVLKKPLSFLSNCRLCIEFASLAPRARCRCESTRRVCWCRLEFSGSRLRPVASANCDEPWRSACGACSQSVGARLRHQRQR